MGTVIGNREREENGSRHSIERVEVNRIDESRQERLIDVVKEHFPKMIKMFDVLEPWKTLRKSRHFSEKQKVC